MKRALATIIVLSVEVTPAAEITKSLAFLGDPQKASATASVFEAVEKTAAPKNTTPTFTMKQSATASENEIRVSRTYSDATGAPALEEVAIYKDRMLSRFEFHQKQLGEIGIGRIEDGKVFYEYIKNGKIESAEEMLEDNFVPSDQIYPYLVSRWSAIMNKEDVVIRFPVLQRTESVGFRFRWNRQIERDGQKLEVIRMEPSSLFIRLLVPHIEFFFVSDGGGIHLKEISGRTALNIKAEDSWQPFLGRVLFGKNETVSR
ncbi:MAG: hypothetical protein K2X47_13030 [Bdellovibrionales bacterium]|nr:hypothetical protein [Bdellovibrionales bacterium]